jgi:DHA2 family multidrug resistance protein
MAERRQDFHQSRVGGNLTASSFPLQGAIERTQKFLETNGYSPADALKAATLRYYDQLGAQTHLLAFMDCFHIIGVVTLVAAPLVWLTKNFKVGGKVPEGH